MTDDKNAQIKVSSKIVCAKCGRTEYVPFHADGRREYLCSQCLKRFNIQQKTGKIKQVTRYGKIRYEFICAGCGNYSREAAPPPESGNGPMCRSCRRSRRSEERRSNSNGKVILQK